MNLTAQDITELLARLLRAEILDAVPEVGDLHHASVKTLSEAAAAGEWVPPMTPSLDGLTMDTNSGRFRIVIVKTGA